jgi:hypothetical protein
MASRYAHATQVFAELTLTMTHSSKIKVLIAHGDPLIAAGLVVTLQKNKPTSKRLSTDPRRRERAGLRVICRQRTL